MPPYNVTIDDTSALLQYSIPNGNGWTDSPTSDPNLGSYWSNTYHSAFNYLAAATLQFEGTAVYLYAAKRSRHGAYVVYLDGKLDFNGTGYSLVPQYKVLMYSATNLSPGWHNITCVNDDRSNTTYTEVDFVTWTTTMNSNLFEVAGTTIPHTPDSMSYSSLAAWTEETDSAPTMVTSTYGASVSIKFNGNGIVLNGKTGVGFGLFSAQVDNYEPHQLNAFSQQTHSTLLFRQDNLPDGDHTLVVTNRGYGSLSIGSATPIIWSSDPDKAGINSTPDPPSTHKTNTGIIVGAIVAGVVSLALLALLILCILRRRRRKQTPEHVSDNSRRAAPTFIHTTPFVLPVSPTSPQATSSVSTPHRENKFIDDSGMLGVGTMPYHVVPGSPGLSSRGSFEAYGQAGAGSSSAGTSSVGWTVNSPGGPARRGQERRPTGLTLRQDTGEYDQESMRDRDAGPIMLPQLPPAYSSAAASLPQSTAPASPVAMMASPGPIENSSSKFDAYRHAPTSRV